MYTLFYSISKPFLAFVCLFSICMKGQSQEIAFTIVKADTTWGREIIQFPIEWAPKMDVVGFEELRFAPDWSNPESNEFWSLVMAWKLHRLQPMQQETLEANIIAYFDGLMKPNHWAEEFASPAIQLFKVGGTATQSSYSGSLKLFDGFYTGIVLTLNTRIETTFYEEDEISIVIIRLSPQEESNVIWRDLTNIKISEQN